MQTAEISPDRSKVNHKGELGMYSMNRERFWNSFETYKVFERGCFL